jgi:signal transduction histidine kinase/ligand-binding sensor domain-containing protein
LQLWILAWVAGFCLLHGASALDPGKTMSQYVHDRWGEDNGFLQGAIYAISQSPDGYLWVGTERGLVRFDGFSYKLIQRPIPDLPPTGPVRGLVSDAEGNMWVRLNGPRMLRYRDGRFDDAVSDFGLEAVTFTAMSPDGSGGMLLSGLGDRTVLRYTGGKFKTLVKVADIPGTVISMAETRDHRVWIGTPDHGLFHADGGTMSTVIPALANKKINTLLAANSGGLWIGTDEGLLFWDGTQLQDRNLPPLIAQLQILALANDPQGNIWVGTNRGLVRITAAGAVALDQLSSGPGADVTTIYLDRDGALWFGGSRGIERLRDGMFTTYSNADGLPSDSNGSIYIDTKGRTWFAPLTGGLYWFKGTVVQSITLAGLDNDVVYSISGGNDEICVGRQRGGLTVLTEKAGGFVARTYTQNDGLAQNGVYSVLRTGDGTLWAGTISGGISRLKDGVFTAYSVAQGLSSDSIHSIIEANDGSITIATPAGLDVFRNGHWTNSALGPKALSDVRSIFEDAEHVLWIATAEGLAFRYFGHVEIPHQLPDSLREPIYGISEDASGSLWISTSDHVLRVNREHLITDSLTDLDVQSYGKEDGLLGTQGVNRDRSMTTDHFGRIWISLNRGIAVTDAKPTAADSAPDAVRLESTFAEGRQVDLQASPEIAAGNRIVTFNFAGTSLSNPERTRFRYKLDDSDRHWSNAVTQRQVTYTNLGPGYYRFHIMASNNEGLWNGPETIISFRIARAFWQTWWFQGLYIAVVVLGMIVLYRLRIYFLTRRLNVRFQERLAERTRIAQELHDTLLQGVLSASMQLDVAEDQVPENSPAKPLLRRVLQLMGQVTEEGRTALRGLRTTQSDNLSLEKAFSRMRQELDVSERIGYRVVAQSATRPLRPLIRDEVYRIGREALVNAFRHASASTVEVEVDYASDYLRVMIRDDGRGIDPVVLQTGRDGHWGLVGMRERSESIGGKLKLRSRVGAGTEIELVVPSAIAFEGKLHRTPLRWRHWLSRGRSDKSVANDSERGSE